MAEFDVNVGKLVIVTGTSGAGRSTALSALEDLGYYCVDSLPPQAFEATLAACRAGSLLRVALGVDPRVESFLTEARLSIEPLRRHFDFTLLFLDATDAALLARFSSTRRPHPLRTLTHSESERSLMVLDGIQLERERLMPLRAEASLIIDTSELNVHELRRRIVELFGSESGGTGMVTRLLSFGYRYGLPGDCDLVFDVRFLDNPYFVPELSAGSGLDQPVWAYVRAAPRAEIFKERVSSLLETLIPWYEEEGKSYLTVGFGCTGGRHRSVAMAEWVAERVRGLGAWSIGVAHRDIRRAEGAGSAA
jgi:UPF0042 nucleotide-binding protein